MRGSVVAALAGLSVCGVAAAQTLRVELTFGSTSIAVGETTTATLTAYFTGHPAGAYLSSVNIDLIASSSESVSNVAAVAWNNRAQGFDGQGTASGADVLGIEAAQFSLIPPVTPGSPIVITTFTVTGSGCGTLRYTARVSGQAPAMFTVTGGFFSDPAIQYNEEVFFSDRLVCPSPGAVGVLACAGLAGARRRRGWAGLGGRAGV